MADACSEHGLRWSFGRQWGTFDILVGSTLVEFESTVGPPGLCGLTIDEMISRAERTTAILGFPHLVPEVNDHALFLCVNAFKDKIVRTLPHVLSDLVRISRHRSFNPARLVELTRRADSRTVVWMVADWAATEGGADGWRSVRDAIGARPPRGTYLRLFRHLLHSSGELAQQALRVVTRAGSDRPAEQLRALTLTAAGAARWRVEAFRMARGNPKP
jgi:hypothetical protein